MNYKAIIYRKTNRGKDGKGRYKKLREISFSPDDKVVKYPEKTKNRSYLVDLGAISHEDDKNAYLCFDYDTGDYLTFSEVETTLSPEDTDELVYHNIVASLFSRVFMGLSGMDKGKLLTYIIIFIVGAVLGYFVNASFHTSASQGAQGVANTVRDSGVIEHVSESLRGLLA